MPPRRAGRGSSSPSGVASPSSSSSSRRRRPPDAAPRPGGSRNLYPDLERRGVRVLGISVDELSTQTGFAEDCGADFPVAADPDKKISGSYGVLGFLGYAKRVTFFVGPDGKVVERTISALPGTHLDRARQRYLSAP